LLAQENFDGPAEALEGERGFLRVFGDNPDIESVARGLGESWEIMRNTYKPYPCGIVLNPVIEACLDLAERLGAPDQVLGRIESIELAGHSLLRQRTDRPGVETGRQSQVSA